MALPLDLPWAKKRSLILFMVTFITLKLTKKIAFLLSASLLN